MSFQELLGSHLMIGISGTKVTPEILSLFRRTHAAGLIVFRPNFESAAAFQKLISGLEEKLGRRLLIAVDHEGGRVIHLAEGITVFPDNWTLGNTGKNTYAAKQGEIEAGELRRLGLDLNLAPTVDVLTETFSPNIGIRSYGKSASLVSRLGGARISGMQKNGLSACAKHFPGLGASPLDPHLDLPVLASSLKDLEKVHLKPFQAAIRAGVDCIMSTHVVLPKIDATKMPATFSKKIITGILRKKLKYQGVVLTDDLEMGALKGICEIGEAAVRAVEAGHDMVLACHDPKAPQEIYDALFEAYQSSRLSIENLNRSAARIKQLINKRPTRFTSGFATPQKEGAKLSQAIASEGVTVRKGKKITLLPEEKVSVIFPKISELAKRFYIEPSMLDESSFIKRLCRIQELSLGQTLFYSLDSPAKDADALCSESDAVIYFCYDAHLSKTSKSILETVLKKAKQAMIVLLRDPYDAALIPKNISVITVYGFREVQIKAAFLKMGQMLEIRQGSLH